MSVCSSVAEVWVSRSLLFRRAVHVGAVKSILPSTPLPLFVMIGHKYTKYGFPSRLPSNRRSPRGDGVGVSPCHPRSDRQCDGRTDGDAEYQRLRRRGGGCAAAAAGNFVSLAHSLQCVYEAVPDRRDAGRLTSLSLSLSPPKLAVIVSFPLSPSRCSIKRRRSFVPSFPSSLYSMASSIHPSLRPTWPRMGRGRQ